MEIDQSLLICIKTVCTSRKNIEITLKKKAYLFHVLPTALLKDVELFQRPLKNCHLDFQVKATFDLQNRKFTMGYIIFIYSFTIQLFSGSKV